MNGPLPIKVLIADDALEVRRVEKRLLENEREIEVIGEAIDAVGAIRLTRKLSPDVVVMDLNMPGDGFTATRDVKAVRPEVKVIAVTATPELYESDVLCELGADTLLCKTEIGQELVPAIKRLAGR